MSAEPSNLIRFDPEPEDREWETRPANPIRFSGDKSPKPAFREEFEQPISRKHAASVASDLSGRRCWAVKRKIGPKKICVIHVDQGEGMKSLVIEGSDWWIALRALYSYLKNRGQLSIDEGEGGEVVTV